MLQSTSGVLLEEDVSFHSPSSMAKRLYMYLLCCGRYVCNGSYRVDRQRYDSYLLLYVVRGHGYCGNFRLKAGDLTLVNCYQPHIYGTDEDWEIMWCHFDGTMAAAFADQLTQLGRLRVTRCGNQVEQAMLDILKHSATEARVHLALTGLLTAMLSEPDLQHPAADHLNEVKGYISQHFAESMPLEKMAAMAHLSPYHFTRMFQRETGTTPHAYLLRMRVNAACYYLRFQDNPICEVAWQCGFASESAFCKVFKRMMGQSPRAYRLSGNADSLSIDTKE